MTAQTPDNFADDRVVELLAGFAATGLDPEERTELDALLAADGVDIDAAAEPWERLASEADLAGLPLIDDDAEVVPPMPQGLRERLIADAVRFSSHGGRTRPPATVEIRPADIADIAEIDATDTPTSAAGSATVEVDTSPLAKIGPWLGWAAAAAILIVAWGPFAGSPTPTPAPAPTLAERLASAGDLVVIALDDSDAGISGSASWSPSLQTGEIRIAGLAANDPTDRQYQIWVVDGRRAADGQQHPAIDGGVFDVPADGGEVVVPIDAKLDVFDLAAVAITSEPPGGVVKHDPELDPDRYSMLVVNTVEAD